MIRTIVPLAGLIAAAVAFAAPANATTSTVSAQADLNGDGKLETVTAEADPANPAEQVLTTTVRGKRLTARVPADDRVGVQPLRVADINDDGRAEIIVTEAVGANTDHFSIWGLFRNQLRGATLNGMPFKMYEGGGISAISRYGCEDGELVTADGLIDWDTGIYTGERITYKLLRRGVLVETSRIPVSGPREAPVFDLDPRSC